MNKTGDVSKRKDRRILIGAILLALLIMAGSTFAWTSAREEVTNLLTAEVSYNVEILEDFKAPTSWEPGEVVDKVVGLTNTGDISAFGGIAVSNQIRVAFWATEAFSSGNTAKYRALSPQDVQMIQGSQTGYTPAVGVNTFTKVDYIEQDGTEVTREDAYYYDGTTCYEMVKDSGGSWAMRIQGETETGTPTLDFSKLTTDKKITATYTSGDKSMVINILMANDWADNWTFDGDHSFYLNSALVGGTASPKLIRALELDNSVQDGTYVKFDYALVVGSFSAQIQPSTVLAEAAASANAENWTMKVTGGTVTPNGKKTTVTGIVWSAAPGI